MSSTQASHNGRLTQVAGFTLWLTGLSGAGKSTIAHAVGEQLRRHGARVEILDGDEIRLNLSKGLGFSREDRDTNIRRIGYVAKLLTRNGVAVIPAAISPYRATRDEVRRDIGAFVEVFVKASLDECIRRDTKGLYKKALAGELVVDTEHEDVATSARRVIARLVELGYLQGTPDA